MPINFPDSPSLNDTHTVGDKTWIYNGSSWDVVIANQAPNQIRDADNDTKIETENTADDDTLRFSTAGTERMTITSAGHLIPSANVTYDLGSASNRFRDLYLSGTSINLGGAEISSDGTNLTMPPVSNIGGDFTVDTDTLHVDSTNNRVGIGTTTPDVPLHIDGDAGNNEIAKLQSSQTASTYSLVGITDANETAKAFIGFNPGASLNNTDSYLMLGMNGDDVNGGNGVIVRKGGNVGIGTNSPTARLDVAGEVQSAYVTLDRDGMVDGVPSIDILNSAASTGYTYVLRAWNDSNATATMFVNGTNRTSDGGASTMTFRNDAGPSRFGNASFATTIEGTSVVKPGVSAFLAVRDAGSLTGVTDIVFNTVHFNIGNDYNASTGVYTAPVDGVYFVSFHGMSDNGVDIAWLELLTHPGGVQLYDINPYGQQAGTSTAQYEHSSFAGVIPLSAGDGIKIGTRYGLYAVGNAHNSFSVYQIG